ncbi:tryptophan halogenase family protein [Qipengyuania sphaerica]|uniref:tryptophan halogenase family protein n=1 Tax=Qipengyuania sphaerica TaxID=2867243 RepID=UPI001C876DB0|nr:tryptophan halogenase family protein [Qipengyuania sphaerica]MBX7541219.1 tryptophan 7-halogenase [Qipengyuania sphaerica]
MKIEKVCILGGGTAGWMTAAGLSHKLKGSQTEITLIESEQIGTVGVGEATLPSIRFFNNTLGIDEATFMRETSATFKLGIEFCDWGRIGDRYIHPFGEFGEKIRNVDFHHYWTRLRLSGDASRLDDYSYPIIMSELGRFQFPDPDPAKIEASFGYAYQMDASAYARLLRRYAEANGVKRVEGKVTGVEQDSETGHVSSVKLESGASVAADLFIDCTGFRGLLIRQTLEAGNVDWTKWLPCNRAIAIPCRAADRQITPFTRATARKAGWQWRIPLQHRIGNGHVYCSEYISDDEACDVLCANLEGEALAEPNQLYFQTGRLQQFWKKNVVAIGLSAGFLEPLESTSIYLIQEGITALLELFPGKDFRASDADEYNRRMELYFERVRDFLILHYIATERADSEMWRYFTNMKLPDSLQERLDAWLLRGHIIKYEFGAFLPPSWIAVMAGQNLLPAHFDRRVDALQRRELVELAAGLKARISSSARGLPGHLESIQAFGASTNMTA